MVRAAVPVKIKPAKSELAQMVNSSRRGKRKYTDS
jgi:hypothetical protein